MKILHLLMQLWFCIILFFYQQCSAQEVYTENLLNMKSFSNQITCQELYDAVLNYGKKEDYVSIIISSMLEKVEYYTLEDMGFVIAYIKENEYDFKASPYIFCGIPYSQWRKFKSEGMFGSWGESFHTYIMDYKCNCQ